MNDQLQLIKSYLRTMWIYRWVALCLSTVICLGGWAYVAYMPSTYEVQAKIFIDTRSMLQPLLRGLTVNNNMITNTAALMRRTLLTRPTLEEVARRADLDLQTTTSREFETLVTDLSKEIRVSGTSKDNIYQIYYADQNPQVAKRVVDELLNTFLETALGETRKDTVVTQKFLDEQIAEYERRLIEAEERLKEFKQRNAGMMPGDQNDYFGRLSSARSELAQAELMLREAVNRRDAVAAQIAGEEPVFGFGGETFAAQSPQVAQIDSRLAGLREKLDSTLLQYTEKHPDVKALRATIESLEAQREEELARMAEVSPGGPAPLNTNPVYQQMRVSLSNADAEVAALTTRVAEYRRRVEKLQELADTVPEVEAEYARLNRDYGLHKKNYQELIERREAARMSQEVERTGDDIKLRVIEPPRIPLNATGPDRVSLLSLVFVAAFGVGGAFAFLLAQLKPRFFTLDELRESIELPILGAVSLITNERYRRKRRLEVAVFSAVFGVVVVLYAGLVILGMKEPGVYESFNAAVSRVI